MICALLAVLELVRLQAIVLTQKEIFGAIRLRKHKMFDVVFLGGNRQSEAASDTLAVTRREADRGGNPGAETTMPNHPTRLTSNYQ